MEKDEFARFVEEVERSRQEFWQQEYPRMSRAERVDYWLASTHRGMRTQGEATGDEYTEFSAEWYAQAQATEPDFEALFREAVTRLGFSFDWDEYRRRIMGQ